MKIAYLSIAGLVLMLAAHTAHSDNCQKPNPNATPCRSTPSNWISSCYGIAEAHCSGSAMYDIKLFPDGAVPDYGAPAYNTKSESNNCWKTASCSWNTNGVTPLCDNVNGWGPWNLAAKTITHQDTLCREAPSS